MVRNQLWLVDPGIKMFSEGQSKGHLQSQGDSILFLIQEVCFSVLFEIVITSVSKVKEVAESMSGKYMDGTYILIANQTFPLQIKAYTQMKSNNFYDLIKISKSGILSKRTSPPSTVRWVAQKYRRWRKNSKSS